MKRNKYMPGIAIARAIVKGDYQRAYILRSLMPFRRILLSDNHERI